MERKVHELKSWPEFFQPIWDDKKRFELRRNDRDFKTADILMLREWNPETTFYTGRVVMAEITYILPKAAGLYPDYVICGTNIITKGTLMSEKTIEAYKEIFK